MTCSCQADNKWWNGVEMVVTLQVDMVDMVRRDNETFLSSLEPSQIHVDQTVCLSRLHNNLFWLGARSSWPQSKQKFSTHRNFKSGEPMRNCRFERFAGCWSRSTCPTYVPHLSHICPTYVPHMSHICPTYVPHMSHMSLS